MSKLRNMLFLSILVMATALAGIQSPVHAAAFAPAVSLPAGAGPSAIVTGQFVSSHIVSVNISQSKPVTASNSPAFGSPALITNNVFAPEGTGWNNSTYAVELNEELRIDLGQPYPEINRVIVQADDNDTYRVEYSLDGILWTALYNVPVSSGGGLRTRDSGTLGAVSARYIRIYATGGDGLFSVSELQVFSSSSGIRDIAVANFTDNTVSVMLGNGDGTFSRNDIAVGTEPYAVISGDFNSDGKADLAVANSGSNDITILFGDGAGGFPTTATYAAGSTPYSLTSGDLDGDGFIDIAVANLKSSNITVLIGDGIGGYTATEKAFPAGGNPVAIIAADFNVDELVAKDELAVADSQNNVTILSLTKNADSTYTMTKPNKYVIGPTPLAMVKGDFNGDGLPDLAVAISNNKEISVLLGLGSNMLDLSQYITVDQFPAALTAEDLNGDGLTDLAATHLSNDRLSVIYGNGNGKFQEPLTFAVGSSPIAVAAGDFDSDGHIDLITTNYKDDTLSFLINTPNAGINVTSPAGGEHIRTGSAHLITWDAFPGAVSYMVYHSENNGKTFKKLAKVGSVTSYNWNFKLPKTLNSNDNIIKIVGYNASKKIVAEGMSKSTFAIEAARIVFPNGGEEAAVPGTLTIGWETYTTKKTPTSIKLSYWDGGSWKQIESLNPIPFPPMYTWVIPAFTETRHCFLIKIELKAGSTTVATDITDRYFTITAP